ncbi:hypothetical protein MXB_4275 [Myxobolus squamalis]|nr:hypothetical protein MXB_4275 [Myxobolus squamalis]
MHQVSDTVQGNLVDEIMSRENYCRYLFSHVSCEILKDKEREKRKNAHIFWSELHDQNEIRRRSLCKMLENVHLPASHLENYKNSPKDYLLAMSVIQGMEPIPTDEA